MTLLRNEFEAFKAQVTNDLQYLDSSIDGVTRDVDAANSTYQDLYNLIDAQDELMDVMHKRIDALEAELDSTFAAAKRLEGFITDHAEWHGKQLPALHKSWHRKGK